MDHFVQDALTTLGASGIGIACVWFVITKLTPQMLDRFGKELDEQRTTYTTELAAQRELQAAMASEMSDAIRTSNERTANAIRTSNEQTVTAINELKAEHQFFREMLIRQEAAAQAAKDSG